jgi:hypothetical protein
LIAAAGRSVLQNAGKPLVHLRRIRPSFAAKPLLQLQEAVLRLLMGRLTSSYGGAAAAPQFRGVR